MRSFTTRFCTQRYFISFLIRIVIGRGIQDGGETGRKEEGWETGRKEEGWETGRKEEGLETERK